MISPLVIVAVEHAVGQITLNRPDKRNALTAAMLQQILDGLDCFERGGDVAGELVLLQVVPVGALEARIVHLAELAAMREHDAREARLLHAREAGHVGIGDHVRRVLVVLRVRDRSRSEDQERRDAELPRRGDGAVDVDLRGVIAPHGIHCDSHSAQVLSLALVAFAGSAQAQTATQTVTFEVKPINQIAFVGAPSLIITTAVAGSAHASAVQAAVAGSAVGRARPPDHAIGPHRGGPHRAISHRRGR